MKIVVFDLNSYSQRTVAIECGMAEAYWPTDAEQHTVILFLFAENLVHI